MQKAGFLMTQLIYMTLNYLDIQPPFLLQNICVKEMHLLCVTPRSSHIDSSRILLVVVIARTFRLRDALSLLNKHKTVGPRGKYNVFF